MADANVNTVSMTEKQKVKEITDKLEEGLKELFESEKYKNYLSTMSKFHNYSFNNTLLIAMQKPEATLVAGYQAWQKNFNRHVNKGEKGIRILAPAPYKIKEERDKLDPVTGEVMLDKDGMPQTEEVEIKIPAFRAVSVFDVSQTDGEPLPELEAKELLSTVEGYEDFIKAITFVAPVSVSFEDIPGDSRGFFSPEEKRIAVQEGMSESQTLKTMVHETAHSMLHDKDVNKDILAPAKDRNTKEVEAESIAFKVCNHFGIDTSEYSFGYIAGWSSGKDMKELKSSLDTIHRTASELITVIEGQLKELQRDREIMQDMSINGQEKESLLLVQNSDLSEYSLLNVRGMDATEVVEALSAMNDDDRLNVAAYLESRGAWTTEIANQDTKEFGEYHIDVRYYTDTNEIVDLKAEMAWNERAKEPVAAEDVILKITHSGGFEVERITNKTPEEVQEIMGALTKLENIDAKNIHDCLERCGADYIPIIVSGGRNYNMPQFNDYEIDLDKKKVAMMSHLSPAQQAEGIINRLEFTKTAFSDDERNLIVNYAYKLNDMEKTRELAGHIYYEETEGNQGAALAVIDAQAEIDALPDPVIGLSEMEEYGYTWNEMLPLTQEKALELFDHDLPVYLLHEDGSETTVDDRKQIIGHEGIFGIEKGDWENEKKLRTMLAEVEESSANKEAQLLYGDTGKYGIYQLKDNSELRDFYLAGTAELLKGGYFIG
ncbi:MAG: ArdC-like ssDNA-binding domain-containing protein [Lachnospiraceae bacterium]|nr:ArdC-like ssDNA-binding domain-containing protein [Lachnospiraceae bacterium]